MVFDAQTIQTADEVQDPTIIVIDDDDAVRESTRMLLEARRYVVLAHTSAESFLASDCGEVFVLLVDHHMPGMTGTELLEMLHAKLGKVFALMMTGRTDPTIEARCSRIGVKLLQKPVVEDHLLEAIEAACRAYTSRHSPRVQPEIKRYRSFRYAAKERTDVAGVGRIPNVWKRCAVTHFSAPQCTLRAGKV